MALKDRVTQIFKKHFDAEPTHFFRAPGRVNLIGEHTDYNDGFVLPCAINYDTVIAARARDDKQISLVAADYDEQTSSFSLEREIRPDRAAPWSNYARGVAWALLIDCRSLAYRAVPIPAGAAIIIANSNVQRGLVDSEYNTRRRECEAAAAHFGVSALRDVPPDLFALHEDELPETVARRARHVITENARTEAAAEALARGDLTWMGQLMAESHTSMRDDFEITVPPINALVEIMADVIGPAGGARMTGGGFGGCVVALAPQALVTEVEATIASHYPAASGLEATVYVCRASAGAGEI